MSEYLVNIKNERLSFFTPAGEVKALNDVSLHLKEGEVLGIVGESGSGKSVTAYSLMGITAYPGRLIGGSLEFNGHEIEKMSEKELRKVRGNEISIIFQDPMTSLNPVYSIGNQIREVIMLHTDKNKQQANERAKELLTLVGINEPEKRLKQYPHELSGGMRQRVMIDVYKRQPLWRMRLCCYWMNRTAPWTLPTAAIWRRCWQNLCMQAAKQR